MQELLEYIVKALADNKEKVNIHLEEDEKNIRIKINVAEEDMGKIIGKQGRIAKAIRTIARAAASNSGKRSFVEIEE